MGRESGDEKQMKLKLFSLLGSGPKGTMSMGRAAVFPFDWFVNLKKMMSFHVSLSPFLSLNDEKN